MIVTGKKRWVLLVVISLLAGIMVYVPYLRYSYYDQMVMLFTQSTGIADPDHVNEFIGNFTLVEAMICMIGYPFGGYIADKFSEKTLLILGGLLMGLSSFWFGMPSSEMAVMIINALYGVGVLLIFSPYLKATRKLGTTEEQGKMFSVSEFVRAVTQIILGFLAVGLLNRAVLPGNTTDPQLLAVQWRNALFLDGAIFIVIIIAIFFLMPSDLRGAETAGMEVHEEKITVGTALQVLKMPGTWLVAFLIFFCYSFTACGSGYLGTYTVNVIGISASAASTFAIVRNYIIGAVSTLAIGFVADKIGFKVKTLGFYLAAAVIATAALIFSGSAGPGFGLVVCVVFAFIYTGMRGIYFATMEEVGIPLALNGVATGIISFICYLPDVYFAKIAGIWLDKYGNAGFTYIWIWAIGCGILGIIVAFLATRYANKLKAQKEQNTVCS